jgi:hypothetical protein
MEDKVKTERWTVRARKWPNGRPYFIVMKGKYLVLVSDKGVESCFPDKATAQYWADEHNKPEPTHEQ